MKYLFRYDWISFHMQEEFISKNRMEQMTTVSPLKSKYFVIFILFTAILVISFLLFITVKSRQSSSQIPMKLISKQTTSMSFLY